MANGSVDIFENPYKTQQTWAAQGAVVNYTVGSGTSSDSSDSSGTKCVPILMEQIQVQYQRKVQALYPLNQRGSKLTKCVVTGAPAGTLQIQGIYAPTLKDMDDFLGDLSKPCKEEKDQVTMYVHPFGTAQCNNDGYNDQCWVLGCCELESIALTIQSGEAALVRMPITISFSSLNITGLEGTIQDGTSVSGGTMVDGEITQG